MPASDTPNVVIQNPTVRRIMGIVLGVALIVLPAAAVLDVNIPTADFSAWLVPSTAVTSFLAGCFGLGVTTPNVPRAGAVAIPTAPASDGLNADEIEADRNAALFKPGPTV